MATVTRENIGSLHDKLTVTLSTEDYLGAFEQNLKKYAKTANIPGFRKGMVPAGLVKKMYGQSVFSDEVLKNVEKSLNEYLTNEKLEIFAQPLPLDNDASALDMNNPKEYSFAFEVGLKPNLDIDLKSLKAVRYKVVATEEMINEEVARLQTRFGKLTEPEVADNEENVLNVKFVECDKDGNEVEGGIAKDNSLLIKYFAEGFRKNLLGKKKDESVVLQLKEAFEDKELDVIVADLGLNKDDAASAEKYFKLNITKVGFVNKAELNEELFIAAYPSKEIKTADEFLAAVKEEIEGYFVAQSRNQLHDQIYHHLLDHTTIELPASFLKRWLQIGGEKAKSVEEAEAEYPGFADQLKWTLITSKLTEENKIEVLPDDIRDFAKQQLFQYMGGQLGALGDNQQWVDDYANRMMQDKKFVEDSYHRISSEKMFTALESQVSAKEEEIGAEEFASKLHHHHH